MYGSYQAFKGRHDGAFKNENLYFAIQNIEVEKS